MVLVYGLDQRGRRGVSYLDRSIDDVFELSRVGVFGCDEEPVNDAVAKGQGTH